MLFNCMVLSACRATLTGSRESVSGGAPARKESLRAPPKKSLLRGEGHAPSRAGEQPPKPRDGWMNVDECVGVGTRACYIMELATGMGK